ncbi:MAG: SdpI family protein [Gemmataceae bacterium]
MKAWLWVSVALTVLAVGVSWAVWENRDEWLPEQVPTHWNAANVADRHVPRDEMLTPLLLVPGMMVGMMALAVALPWLSPVKFKIEPFRPTYDYIMMLVVAMFFYMHVVITSAYMGLLTDVGQWIVGGILVLLGAMGNVMGKVKRNFYVGIRTPWTLASGLVWERTHRLGGWLMVAGSVAGLILLFAGVHPLASLGVLLVAAIAPVFYSLWLYKRLEKEGRLGEQQ